MGCRHAQSFFNRENDYEIHILEPCSDNIEKNLNLINSSKNDSDQKASRGLIVCAEDIS